MKSKGKKTQGPLSGIKILDLSRLYPGPLATMLLADMGAEVIKIEDLKNPDPMRLLPPYIKSESAGFLAINRSKKSIALDLNSEEGKKIFFQLVKSADIVVEQFRPGIIDKLGLGYEEAVKVNPSVIYVSVTGYGQDGPFSDKAGHDLNYISYGGILSGIGRSDTEPVMPSFQIADTAGGGYMTVIACLSALWSRQNTNKGQKVDVSMLDSILPLISLQFGHFQATEQKIENENLPLSGGIANYNIYKCFDDKYITIGALEPKFWKNFCEMIEKSDWSYNILAMGVEKQKLYDKLSDVFKTKTRDEWVKHAENYDVCISPVLDISEIENNEHLIFRKMFIRQEHPAYGEIKGIGIPIKFSETPCEPSGPPPVFGEHTQEILTEVGYSVEEINGLQQKKIIK